jgi:hypothetical protein|tara:strand:- start:386 stop:646 length:261 start_codon:yes stop_codon:yes gene_type:complete
MSNIYTKIEYKEMTVDQLAAVIRLDWTKLNYAARPYLDAMDTLEKVSDNYHFDSGRSVVSYFLANASTWRGETARNIKTELKQRIK